MITRFKHSEKKPYSLHDMVVNKISLEDGSVHFRFEHGFVRTEEPYPQVEGNMTVEKIDPDFACVFLLSPNGRYGNFSGQKLSLETFIDKYRDISFEIVDEMYGYNTVEYGGYLSLPGQNDLTEMILWLYFEGDIVYETDENQA